MAGITNKDIMEAVKLIAGNKQCKEHSKLLKEHAAKFENAARLQAAVQSMEETVQGLNETLQSMHTKMFVSNGNLCFSEDLRITKTNLVAMVKKVDNHIKEHTKNKLTIGQKITIGSTIILALLALLDTYIGKIKTNDDMKKVKEAINVIAKQGT